jgi:hypothetical protein
MLMNMKNDDVIAMTCLVRRSHAYDVDLLVAFIYLLEGWRYKSILYMFLRV